MVDTPEYLMYISVGGVLYKMDNSYYYLAFVYPFFYPIGSFLHDTRVLFSSESVNF